MTGALCLYAFVALLLTVYCVLTGDGILVALAHGVLWLPDVIVHTVRVGLAR